MKDNIAPFVSNSERRANLALEDFIDWAKASILSISDPDDPVIWSSESWIKWGIKNSRVSKLKNPKIMMDSSFIDFAKAYIFRCSCLKGECDSRSLMALRLVEASMLEMGLDPKVTDLNAAVFEKACVLLEENYNASTPYKTSRHLKAIHEFLIESNIVKTKFSWEPQIREKRQGLKAGESEAKRKLPDENVLIALGELFFNNSENIDDVFVTSSVAILLSHPSRIGELRYLTEDCLFVEPRRDGSDQLYMLWYGEKRFGATKKIVPDSMAGTCREAVNRLRKITNESREYASWLEENPEDFPYHENVPDKGLDDPLSMAEVCDALMLNYPEERSARRIVMAYLRKCARSSHRSERIKSIASAMLSGFDSKGRRIFSGAGRITRYEFDDTSEITLRKLNLIVRDKYLPRSFPYTDDKKITKFRDALLCFKNGLFGADVLTREKPLGIHKHCLGRLSALLGGGGDTESIFDRHGYAGLKVKSHAFRHWLNNGAQKVELSQELIARWSGRIDVSQNRVYNHISPHDKAKKMAQLSPHAREIDTKKLDLPANNNPIRMSDIGGSSDRILHKTEFGFCTHDYSETPCVKFNSCLSCREHVCLKGDEIKLANLKSELEYLNLSLNRYKEELGEGTYGAGTWFESTLGKIERCQQLIDILEDPSIEDGAFVFGKDDGWTVGVNAMMQRESVLDIADAEYLADSLSIE